MPHKATPNPLATFRGSVQGRSANAKTGPMVTTYSHPASCPTTCPLYGAPRPDGRADAKAPCYAAAGMRTRTAWNRLATGGGLSWQDYLQAIRDARGDMVRVNVAGDLPHAGGRIIAAAVLALASAAAKDGERIAFGYTHHARTPENLATIRAAAAVGLVINASADGPADAFATMAAYPGVPVAAVMPADAPAVTTDPATGARIVTCPAEQRRKDGARPVTCATCGGGRPLCARADRGYAIGFPVHGSQAKRAALAIATATARAAGVKP